MLNYYHLTLSFYHYDYYRDLLTASPMGWALGQAYYMHSFIQVSQQLCGRESGFLPHFTDKNTEVERGDEPAQGHQSVTGRRVRPSSIWLEAWVLTMTSHCYSGHRQALLEKQGRTMSKEGRDSCWRHCCLGSHHLGPHLAGRGLHNEPTQHNAQVLKQKNVQKHRTHIFTYWHRVSWQLSRWGRSGSRPNWTWQQCRTHSYSWWPSYSWSAGGWCSAHTHVVTRCLSCGWNLRGGGESKDEGGIQVGGGPGRLGERRPLALAPSPHPKGKGPSDSWVGWWC